MAKAFADYPSISFFIMLTNRNTNSNKYSLNIPKAKHFADSDFQSKFWIYAKTLADFANLVSSSLSPLILTRPRRETVIHDSSNLMIFYISWFPT